MKKIIKNIVLCGLVAGSGVLTSCDDFLTIYPTSSIVEEDYWKDKTDLNNAIMGCYKRIVANDMLNKYILWGEERSDNFERSTTGDSNDSHGNIMNANLLPTYEQFSWTAAYQAINYCNKVLAHGPIIVKNDEAFSNNDWKPVRAEAIAIRALCHFYLVRTFGEIPYVTEDYNNDSQELRLAQSTQLYVLDNIISDLESVVDDAMSDYGNDDENKGRITKKAIYSLLADAYLWRASYKAGENQPFTNIKFAYNYVGDLTERTVRTEKYSSSAESDYQKCIECCDKVIEISKAEKIKKINYYGYNIGGGEIKLELEDLLEQNANSSKSTPSFSTSPLGAYKNLFGEGNAEESIFELQVEGVSYSNNMITSLFWNISGSNAGTLTGAKTLLESELTDPNALSSSQLYSKTDYRRWENIKYVGAGQTVFDINKYINTSVTQSSSNTALMLTDNTPGSNLRVEPTSRTTSKLDANWIVYRMSEIYLMKAEAMSQIYEDEENMKIAFSYIREVFKRSNPIAYQPNNPSSTKGTDSLSFNNFKSNKNIEKLVMAERQREFFAEGKRWFDLVRYALRRGNTAEMLDLLTRKYSNNSKAIRAKLATMQSLYSPIPNSDIKNNNLLYQNGVWSLNETSSQTDNLK